ncbi:unnamed protein product [Sphagnum troendelagicum]
MRSARKEESRARFRRFWLRFRITRGSSRKARRRKLPRPRAMAMAYHEEILLNGRLCQSRLWESQQKSEEATSIAQVSCAPIIYL